MMTIRLIKALIVASIALFWSLVVFNNFTDFENNRVFVKMVLTLDTIQNENVTWRAIDSPLIQLTAYWLLIIWETLTAALCWIGTYRIIKHRDEPAPLFTRAKVLAVAGLTMGFLQYMVGFVVIASEWFYMWQSDLSPMQSKAILFSLLMLACILFVSSNTNEEEASSRVSH